jgi:hypothetical protein
MSALRQIQRRRVVVLALALAWLPYVTLRCIAAPGSAHAGCDVLEHGSEAAAHDVNVGHHERRGHDHEGPASTCCELTGKSSITLSTPFSVDPPILSAIAISLSGAVAPASRVLGMSGGLWHAHAPPTYLRNSTLRI